MSSDPSSIESDLRQLRAAQLDDALLARLEACIQDRWTELDAAEIRFEQQLRQQPPAPLPASLMASLEATLNAVPFPGTKIVRFPQPAIPASTHHHRTWWRAAAAVALIGAVSAWLVPLRPHSPTITHSPPSGPTHLAPGLADKLIPAGFNRGLTEARDEGVVWQANDQPHRVLKVVYTDRVTLKDANGRTYQVEQPRVEYILVPAKTD